MARSLNVEIIGDASSYSRSLRRAEKDTVSFNRQIGKLSHQVNTGGGAFRTLGRSLAFATGGFLAATAITDVLHDSLEQASEAAVAQKQLAAQFKASGQNLETYREQIDKTITRLSLLAGIQKNELTDAFASSFRSTKDVQESLRIVSVAADFAKGRNLDLATATNVLSKAVVGQNTGLRRLVPNLAKGTKGMAALNFVSRLYAGQARAGTTDQERLNVAISNMETLIGGALLPTLERLQKQLAKWFANPENQKKASDGAKNLGKAVEFLAGVFVKSVDAADAFGDAMDRAASHVGNLARQLKLLPQKEGTGFIPGGAGFIPGGFGDFFEGPRRRRRPGGAAAAADTAGPLGFNARLAKLDLALTKAERTVGRADDRAILAQQAALLRERLGKVKKMKDILAVNKQLTQVVQQIQSIDEEQRQKEEDARQKELDARKKAADKARAHAAKLKAQAAAVKAQLQSALDSAITQMGELFDVFVPDDPAKGILGVIGGTVTAKSLTARLKAQNDQAAALNRDLTRLARRGAPPALIDSLRAQGLAGAQNVHALATAGRGDLNTFLRQYARRQRVAQQIAHADIRARNVYINGNIRRTATTPTSQRRGRQAGVIDAAMMAGAGSPWS